VFSQLTQNFEHPLNFCGSKKFMSFITKKKGTDLFLTFIKASWQDVVMPRRARLVIPNCPHHIIQRSHNRQVVFAEDERMENLGLLMVYSGDSIYIFLSTIFCGENGIIGDRPRLFRIANQALHQTPESFSVLAEVGGGTGELVVRIM
jgi:hypothetical protein